MVYRVERKKGPLSYGREPRGGNDTPTCQYLFRRVFGISRSSVQSARTTAPRWPHFAHRACGSNEVIRTSSCQSSTLKVLAWPQALQVAYADRTPRARMCPSVTGWVGRSLTGGSRGFLAMSAKRPSCDEGSRGTHARRARPSPTVNRSPAPGNPDPGPIVVPSPLTLTRHADSSPIACPSFGRQQRRCPWRWGPQLLRWR